MVFSSLQFIYIFLPVFFLLYYLFPENMKWKNVVLFIFSIIFYSIGVWEKKYYLILLLLSVGVNYISAIHIEKTENHKKKKAVLTFGVVYNAFWLVLFKYAGFFVTNINEMTGANIPAVRFILPIGISFYTFQMIAYLADVYRGEVKAEKSVIKLGVFLSMFPQLIAGPIISYKDVRSDLYKRSINWNLAADGLKTFIVGLGLKVLLANRISGLWTQVNTIGVESVSSVLAWLGIFAFTFQIYFDFWGYSLMAIGLGKMMGFTFPQNFNQPYMAKSMTEFWRKWHITLGQWFRKNIYIPLGGNRKGTLKTIRNIFIVWLFTGFWHGAAWNFLIWGLFLFAVMMLEKYVIGDFMQKHNVIGHIYMIFLIPISWLIFAVGNMKQFAAYLQKLFVVWNGNAKGLYAGDYIKYIKQFGVIFLVCILFSTPLPEKMYNKWKNHKVFVVFFVAVFLASVYCMYKGMDDPFLYFQF